MRWRRLTKKMDCNQYTGRKDSTARLPGGKAVRGQKMFRRVWKWWQKGSKIQNTLANASTWCFIMCRMTLAIFLRTLYMSILITNLLEGRWTWIRSSAVTWCFIHLHAEATYHYLDAAVLFRHPTLQFVLFDLALFLHYNPTKQIPHLFGLTTASIGYARPSEITIALWSQICGD